MRVLRPLASVWRLIPAVAFLLGALPGGAAGQGTRTLAVQGTSVLLDERPCPYADAGPFNAICNVWTVGGHATSHRDLFEPGYAAPAVSATAVPERDFSAYHQPAVGLLSRGDRCRPAAFTRAPG